MEIDLDIVLQVDYIVDDPWPEGKLYPITVKKAMFRGRDILSSMHVEHVMQVQRRIFSRLLDSGLVCDRHQAYPIP
jgi:hypothetical protein